MSLTAESPAEQSGEADSLEDPVNQVVYDEASDVFRDSECGEPLLTQHLVLDFTPTEEDTDFIQRKCCAFWEFVNKQPELQGMVAPPDLDLTSESSDNDNVPIQEEPKAAPKLRIKKHIEKTAVSMLELVEEKGLIDRAFESKLPTSHCSLGLINYDDEQPNDTPKASEPNNIPAPRLSIIPPIRTKSQMSRKQRESLPNPIATPTVRDMCQKFAEWDMEHPKSMEPPGPSPNLNNKGIQLPSPAKPIKKCGCDNILCRMNKHKH